MVTYQNGTNGCVTDEYSRRTAITRLTIDDEQHQLLERTAAAWQRDCQLAVDTAWPRYCTQRQLHLEYKPRTYGIEIVTPGFVH